MGAGDKEVGNMRDLLSSPNLDATLRALKPKVETSLTIRSLVSDWKRLALECALGYRFGLHDYLNDLSARSVLHRVIVDSGDEGPQLAKVVVSIDKQFLENTRECRELLLYFDALPSHWWLGRVPNRCGEEIVSDLLSVGIKC